MHRAAGSPRISVYKGGMLWRVHQPGIVPITGMFGSYEQAVNEVRRILKSRADRAVKAIQDGAA